MRWGRLHSWGVHCSLCQPTAPPRQLTLEFPSAPRRPPVPAACACCAFHPASHVASRSSWPKKGPPEKEPPNSQTQSQAASLQSFPSLQGRVHWSKSRNGLPSRSFLSQSSESDPRLLLHSAGKGKSKSKLQRDSPHTHHTRFQGRLVPHPQQGLDSLTMTCSRIHSHQPPRDSHGKPQTQEIVCHIACA